MEVLAGMATVLQLVQIVGQTAIQVSQAYSDIRGVDEILRDFDDQLEATRFQLLTMEKIIESGQLSDTMKTWWDQTDVEGLLRGCQRTYERLRVIFVKIGRQKSSIAGVSAYIKLKRYDGDITHLRLCINTYTSALQLPVIVQSITAQLCTQQLSGEQHIRLLEALGNRMTDLENAMDRTQHHLMARVHEREAAASSTNAQGLESIETTLRGLTLEISHLASSQQNLPSTETTDPNGDEPARPLGEDEDDDNETTEIEDDTRSMLDKTKQLVHCARNYASTLDTFSLKSGGTRVKEKKVSSKPDDSSGLDAMLSQALFAPDQRKPSVAAWAADVEDADTMSVMSLSSNLKGPWGLSFTETSNSTSGTGDTSLSVDSSRSLDRELHERRMHRVYNLVRAGKFEEVIPHLERLLEAGTEHEDYDEKRNNSFARLLLRARYETGSSRPELAALFDKFPDLQTYAEEIHLERAQQMLHRNEFRRVIKFLRKHEPAIFTGTPEDASRNRSTAAKLRIVFVSANIWSWKWHTRGITDECVEMLDWVIGCPNLDPGQVMTAHNLMAEVGTPSQAKMHGMQSVQIALDRFGRDHESTVASIFFMVHTCSKAGDPDESLWRDMLPNDTRQALESASAEDGLSLCQLSMRGLAPLFRYTAAKVGLDYLTGAFEPMQGASLSNVKPEIDWRGCIWPRLVRSPGCSLLGDGKDAVPLDTEVSQPTVLHFLVNAGPTLRKGEPRIESSVDVIRTLLEQEDSDTRRRLLNSCVDVKYHWPLTPLWRAVVCDRKEVVDYLLTLDEVDKGDTEMIEKVIRNNNQLYSHYSARLHPSTMLHASFRAAFNALPAADAHKMLLRTDLLWDLAGSFEIPWCFCDKDLLGALIHRFQHEPDWSHGTIQELLNVALQIDLNPPSESSPPPLSPNFSYDEVEIIRTLLQARVAMEKRWASVRTTSTIDFYPVDPVINTIPVSIRLDRLFKLFDDTTKPTAPVFPPRQVLTDSFSVLGLLRQYMVTIGYPDRIKIEDVQVSLPKLPILQARLDAIVKELEVREARLMSSPRRPRRFFSQALSSSTGGVPSLRSTQALKMQEKVVWFQLKFAEGFGQLLLRQL